MTSGAPDENPLARIRVGDAERDDVVDTLNEAVGQGRISPEEFDQRVSETLAAKTYRDLDAIVADLPVPPPSEAAGGGYGGQPAPGTSEPLVLRATWDNEKRVGRWDVPTHIRIEPVAANVVLNFLEAHCPHRAIDIEVTSGMGTTTVIIPDDWGVSVDHLSKGWGAIRSEVSAAPFKGAPQVIVHGSVGMGSFAARHAGFFERRRLEKS